MVCDQSSTQLVENVLHEGFLLNWVNHFAPEDFLASAFILPVDHRCIKAPRQ